MLFTKLIPCIGWHTLLVAHMLQGCLQSAPLLFLPHMFPQLCGISLRCHSGFVILPESKERPDQFDLKAIPHCHVSRGGGVL